MVVKEKKLLNHFRANIAVSVSLTFRIERRDNFRRLRKSAMYERRGGDQISGLNLVGSFLGARRGYGDRLRSLYLSVGNYPFTVGFWILVDSPNLTRVESYSMRGYTRRISEKVGKKAHRPVPVKDARAPRR
jgi:hypothetical protein